MMPDTEPRLPSNDSRPGVCGYLRAECPDELEIAAWRKEIEQYCQAHDLRLETVFVDRRVRDDQVKRPGIGGVLGVLGLPCVVGVVVPHIRHLSSGGEALAVLRRNIRRTGCEVLCIEEAQDDFKADGA